MLVTRLCVCGRRRDIRLGCLCIIFAQQFSGKMITMAQMVNSVSSHFIESTRPNTHTYEFCERIRDER